MNLLFASLFNKHSRRGLLAGLGLGLALLACSGEGGPIDAGATLDAAVKQTVAAEQTAGATLRPSPSPLPPTPTDQPVINVTLQFPTDTAQPPTQSAEDPTATPTAILTANFIRPNGSPIHALHFSTAPTLDGNLSDWGSLPNTIDQTVYRPENWTGLNDNSAVYAVGWDVTHLYLAAHVTDDVHVQTQLGELIFRGDSLEFLLDADLAGDFSTAQLDADDYQLGLTPGENKIGGPDAFMWFPTDQRGRPAGVTVMAFQDESGNGFFLEAAIPWALFNVTPAGGKQFGFTLSVSDNDSPGTAEQQSMIASTKTRRLTNPTTWGTLILDP